MWIGALKRSSIGRRHWMHQRRDGTGDPSVVDDIQILPIGKKFVGGPGRMTSANGSVASDLSNDLRWPPPRRVNLANGRIQFEINICAALAAATLAVVLLGSTAGVAWFWSRGITAFDAALLVTMMFVTGLGISLGYHRLFSHRAYAATPGLRVALGILGAATLQGSIAIWASTHRRHHRFADRPGDPHSPVPQSRGRAPCTRAFLHAHVGWLVSRELAVYPAYIRDLSRDRCVRFVDRWYMCWGLAGWAAPGLIGAAWYGDWDGYWSGFFAGGPLRSFVQLNLTWLVNSLGHMIGRRPFRTNDQSRNNTLINALTMTGEGLHNNHHAFPWSARLALFPWEIDPSYWLLRLFKRFGWARNIHVPTDAQIAIRMEPFSAPHRAGGGPAFMQVRRMDALD